MTDEELKEIAREILADRLDGHLEYSFVYEDERAEDLTDDEMSTVFDLMNSAIITFEFPDDEDEE
jgi:hypothetical protein